MNGYLPHWLQRLLGIETVPGEGTAFKLEHAWPWPAWLTLIGVVAIMVWVVAIYAREHPETSKRLRIVAGGIRLLLIGLVLAMIAQYVLSLRRTGLPYVAVVIDDSLSTTVADRYEENLAEAIARRVKEAGGEGLRRWELARTLLTENDAALLRGIHDRYKLRLYYLTGPEAARQSDPDALVTALRQREPGGKSTRLGSGVRHVLDDLRGSWPAAIVLVTDGVNTEGLPLEEAAEQARRKGVPLFPVALGLAKPVKDVKLTDLLVDEVVFAGDVVTFEATIAASGYEGRSLRVVLAAADDPETVLAETQVTVPPDGSAQQARIPYRPEEEGEFEFLVRVEPMPDETELDNNQAKRKVRVRKEEIRVLLVQAYPNFEFRYLENMLRRDPTIDLHTVLQEADPGYAADDAQALPGFPVRREDVFAYDAIILGDVNPRLLTDTMMKNLVDFVDQPASGGALILIAGSEYMPSAYQGTPLARLMPIDPSTARGPPRGTVLDKSFVVRPTQLGLTRPQMQLGDELAETETIWKNLPPLYWYVEATDVKPAARILAVHPTQRDSQGRPVPIIVMHYVGAGKVLFHATDETWRWRWRTGDVFFARYWVQTIRYLCRGKLADGDASAILSTDQREYRLGDSVRMRVRFPDERVAPADDDGVVVIVEHKGHKKRRLQLHRSMTARGVFEGTLHRPAIGSYHAWIITPAPKAKDRGVDFTVIAPPGEFVRVETNTVGLQRAAEVTKGRYYTFDNARQLLKDLPAGRQVPIEALPPKVLWNTWPVLAVFLSLLVAEWVLRKVGGMV